ncbi:MAG TPA: hypothetical protein VG675_14220 [Bryobacteraceae bacterium]|nr:hypothetical protein [Bryobacteraceae bacterium]
MTRIWLAAALAAALPWGAGAQVAILQIHVIEGDGAIHAPGSRVAHPLTVEVTNETGHPVPGVAVTFHLPESGPGGTFANQLRTQVLTTDGEGHAGLRVLQVNRTPGRFEIRIIAAKEQARAGTISYQYITEPKSGAAHAARSGHTKWIVIGALVAAGVVGAVVATHTGSSSAPASSTPLPPAISIGPPTVTVGAP